MSENKKTYEEIRVELEARYRAQLEDEVRKRKEIEEKYYDICDKYEDAADKLEKKQMSLRAFAQSNRELLRAKKSFFAYMVERKKFMRRETQLLDKGMEFWGCVFDAKYYAENNPDVVKAVGNEEKALLEHFVTLGIYQERQGSKDFDVEKYLYFNEDVASSCQKDKRDAYLHYIMYGKEENRKR